MRIYFLCFMLLYMGSNNKTRRERKRKRNNAQQRLILYFTTILIQNMGDFECSGIPSSWLLTYLINFSGILNVFESWLWMYLIKFWVFLNFCFSKTKEKHQMGNTTKLVLIPLPYRTEQKNLVRHSVFVNLYEFPFF